MRDVRLRLQPQRQLLHFLESHGLEVFLFYPFTSSEVIIPQVYDAGEEVAVQDGVQALRIRQRVDIGTGGGGHMRRKRATAEDRDLEEQEGDRKGTKNVHIYLGTVLNFNRMARSHAATAAATAAAAAAAAARVQVFCWREGPLHSTHTRCKSYRKTLQKLQQKLHRGGLL